MPVDAPRAAAPNAIAAARPAGFDALMEPQQQVVDLFYRGEPIGQATIWSVPGGLRFDDVDAVIARLPGVANAAAVRDALGKPLLDAHVALACDRGADGGDADCARLPPDQTGVIFDQRHFRADIFVATSQLVGRSLGGRHYLAPSTRALALVGYVSGTAAGSTGGHDAHDRDYIVQTRLIASRGDARVRAEAAYGSNYGLVVDTLVAELDRPGIRYSAGEMWAPGIDIIGRRKLLGIGAHGQFDTRLDRDVVIGSPLSVLLMRRARVDIVRDGQLISSRSYDAGNQTLDTSSLPDGSYMVTLRIQEVGGSSYEERRFFSKNAAIPSAGRSMVFAYGGVLADSDPRRAFASTNTPYGQIGGARRIGPHLAMEATAIATNRTAIGELGVVLLRPQDQIRVAGLVSIHGDAGFIVQANSSGLSRLNYSLDARQLWSSGNRPLLPINRDVSSPWGRSFTLGEAAIGSFSELGATITYRIGPSQVGCAGSYRRYSTGRSYYGFGPSASVPFIQHGGVQLYLHGDTTISNRGRSVVFGLTFARNRPEVSVAGSAGVRSTARTGAEDGTDMVGGLAATWQRDGVLGGTVAATGGLDHEVGATLAHARADLATRTGSFYADLLQPLSHGRDRYGDGQYSVNAATSFSIGGGSVVVDGRRRDDSMVIVAVDGAGGAVPFEVLVDGMPRGTVRSGGSLAVSVPAYRHYAVRVRSLGEGLLRLDAGTREVSVYPGTVAKLRWHAQPVLAMFGRLAWPDGSPVADALVTVDGEIAQSDEHGFFQIETTDGAAAKAKTRDGRSCDARLSGPTVGSYTALGIVTCRPAARPMVIASTGLDK